MQKTLSQGRIFIFEKERNFRGGFCSRWSFRTRNTSVVVLAELCLHHSTSSQFLCPTFNDQCSGSFFPLINTWTGLLQGPMVLLSARNLFFFLVLSKSLCFFLSQSLQPFLSVYQGKYLYSGQKQKKEILEWKRSFFL